MNKMEELIASINVYDYEKYRERVIKECIVTRSTWSNWRNGKPMEAKYKPIIDKIAMEMFGRLVFGTETQDQEGGQQ